MKYSFSGAGNEVQFLGCIDLTLDASSSWAQCGKELLKNGGFSQRINMNKVSVR